MTLMGDETAAAPTLLASEENTAWSLDDGDDLELRRSWRPVVAAVVASVAGLVGVGVLAGHYLQQPPSVPSAATVTVTSVAAGPSSPRPTFHADVPDAATIEPPPPTQVGYTPAQIAPYDRVFVARMQAQGWAVDNPVLFTHRAHQVCAMLEDGEPVSLIQQKMLAQFGFDGRASFQFVSTASNTYPNCP